MRLTVKALREHVAAHPKPDRDAWAKALAAQESGKCAVCGGRLIEGPRGLQHRDGGLSTSRPEYHEATR